MKKEVESYKRFSTFVLFRTISSFLRVTKEMCFFLLFVPPFLLFRCFFPLFFFLLFSFISADDRVHFNDEQEKRWNTPPELTPEQVSRKKPETINGRAEARFLPFSASFSLNAGQDNSEALQLGAGLGGISVSQSSSFSQAEANSFGNTGYVSPK